jgi:hypothetical protein
LSATSLSSIPAVRHRCPPPPLPPPLCETSVHSASLRYTFLSHFLSCQRRTCRHHSSASPFLTSLPLHFFTPSSLSSLTATRTSRRANVPTFRPWSDPSPLFSLSYRHICTTDAAQLFWNQSVAHSFYRDGGCTPPSRFRPSDIQRLDHLRRTIPCVFTSLRILLQCAKAYLFCFQGIPHSLPKTTRGGGSDALLVE